MPKEHKCITSRSEAFIPDATSQIEGLTVITSKEWIEGAEFNSWKLLCTIGDAAPQENFYDPKELVSSRKHPKWIDGQMMESKKISPVVSLKMGHNKIFLDLHIFDILEGDKFSWSVS